MIVLNEEIYENNMVGVVDGSIKPGRGNYGPGGEEFRVIGGYVGTEKGCESGIFRSSSGGRVPGRIHFPDESFPGRL